MRGNIPETIEETWDPVKLEKFLSWELSNIKACRSDRKIRDRIYAILHYGIELKREEKDI